MTHRVQITAAGMNLLLRALLVLLLLPPAIVTAQDPRPAVGLPAVGVLLPLSGPYKSFGESCLRGIQLALGAVGQQTPVVRTVVLDTRGDAGEAANAYRRLASDPGMVAVLGPMLSWEAAAIREESKAAGLPAISFSQRALPPGAPLFRFSMSKEDQVESLVAYLVSDRRLARWAILSPEDSFGQGVSALFRDRVESRGGQIVASTFYDPRQTDFQKEVGRLQGQVGVRHGKDGPLELNIDGIFLPDSAERIRLIAPTLAFFDIRGVQLAGTHGWNENQGETLLQGMPHVNGAVFVDGFFLYSFQPPVRAFVNAFRDAYGSNPGTLEAYGYDAAAMVVEEIRAGAADPARMVRHLHYPRLRSGATGWTTRQANGDFEKQLFLLTMQEGTLREIEREAPPAPPEMPMPPPEAVRPSGAAPTPRVGNWKRPYDSGAPGTLGDESPGILRPQDRR